MDPRDQILKAIYDNMNNEKYYWTSAELASKLRLEQLSIIEFVEDMIRLKPNFLRLGDGYGDYRATIYPFNDAKNAVAVFLNQGGFTEILLSEQARSRETQYMKQIELSVLEQTLAEFPRVKRRSQWSTWLSIAGLVVAIVALLLSTCKSS